MDRSLMLAKKYQHLTISNDKKLSSKFDESLNLNPSKSSAIDSLLAQNEDLNARLKVLLKRLSSIEEENLQLTQEHREIKNQLINLSDELAVYREKESTWKERSITAKETLEIQQVQIRQKEVEFAKLRSQEWEMREHLKSRFEKMEKAYHRLLRYRARIMLLVRPRFKSLLSLTKEQESRALQYKRELQNTEIQCQQLINKNIEQIKRVKEALRQSEEEKISLISQFEQGRKDLNTEIETLRESNIELRKRAGQLERSLERQDYLENKLIYAERENNDLRDQFSEEYKKIQMQMHEWRSKSHSLIVENEALTQKLNETELQYAKTKEISNRLDEQMEAMRHMWKEKVHENEKLRKERETLEQLNSNLSEKLNAELSKKNNITLFDVNPLENATESEKLKEIII